MVKISYLLMGSFFLSLNFLLISSKSQSRIYALNSQELSSI
nr:MAG TPA: hypothetical protein [Caudoviricetes sp.]